MVLGVGFEPTKGHVRWASHTVSLDEFEQFLMANRCKSKATARDHRLLIKHFLDGVQDRYTNALSTENSEVCIGEALLGLLTGQTAIDI